MTIDERIEALTMNLELAHRDIQDLRATVGKFAEHSATAEERHDKEIGAIRAELRRAVRLSVAEARQEHAKRRELAALTVALTSELAEHSKELDLKITQLAAAQLVTEEKLQRFLEARRGNGNPPAQ